MADAIGGIQNNDEGLSNIWKQALEGAKKPKKAAKAKAAPKGADNTKLGKEAKGKCSCG